MGIEFSLINGIFDKEQIEKIRPLFEQLDQQHNNYISLNHKVKNSNKVMVGSPPTYVNFRNNMELVEGKIDTLVNEKMPFLNWKKELNITGF